MATINPWFQFSTPGYAGTTGNTAPGAAPQVPGVAGALPTPALSRMPPQAPQGWMGASMPLGTGMANNQHPALMSQLSSILARGKMVDPMRMFAGMPMNPRYQMYAGMKPDGQIGKGGNPGMMSAYGMPQATMSSLMGIGAPGGSPGSSACCGG